MNSTNISRTYASAAAAEHSSVSGHSIDTFATPGQSVYAQDPFGPVADIRTSNVSNRTAPHNPFVASLGVVLLDCDETCEDALMRMRPGKHVGLHFARIYKGNNLTPTALAACAPNIARAASEIVPGRPLASLAFACTSASAVLGDDTVCGLLSSGRPGPQPTTLLLASARALRASIQTSFNVDSDASRKSSGRCSIALATPYSPELTASLVAAFSLRGIDTVAARCMGLLEEVDVAMCVPADIYALGREAFAAAVQTSEDSGGRLPPPSALFISCSQFRAIDVIEELEHDIGIPVVTSNQAMMWELLRLANVDDTVEGFGQLMRAPARSLFVDAFADLGCATSPGLRP